MPKDTEEEREDRAAWIRQRIKQLNLRGDSPVPISPRNPRDFIDLQMARRNDQEKDQSVPEPDIDQEPDIGK